MSAKQLWQVANMRQLKVHGLRFLPMCYVCGRPALYIRKRDGSIDVKCGTGHVTSIMNGIPSEGEE